MRSNCVGYIAALSCFCFSVVPTGHAQELFSLQPRVAQPGDNVVLHGADFDTTANYTISIGGVNASIVEVTVDSVTFVVPGGAETGVVQISDGTTTLEYGLSLTIVKPISVQHDATLPFSTAGYVIGTFYGDGDPAKAAQTVLVPTLGTTIVCSSHGETGQPLFAISTGNENSLTLNAESTGLALLFIMSGIYTADPVEAQTRLTALAAMPETETLINQIKVHYAADIDILESEYIDDALSEAYFAYINGLAKDRIPRSNPSEKYKPDYVNETLDFRSGYPRDLETPGFDGLRLTKKEAVTPAVADTRGIPKLGIKYKPNKEGIGGIPNNPLDWISNVYELSPLDTRLDTRNEVDALVGDNSAVYDRVFQVSIDNMYIKAKPATKVIDILGFTADLLTSTVPIFNDLRVQDRLSVPADHNGIYIVRNFSGALFPPQNGLVAALPDGRSQDVQALTQNIVIGSFEMLEAVIRISDVLGEDAMAKLILGASKAVGATAARELSKGPITYQSVLVIADELNKYLAKELISKKLIKEIGLQGILRLPKALLKNFDVFAKFEKGSTALLRIAALTNASRLISSNAYMAQSVEDTIVVVGDPWAPRILSFNPVRGHRGSQVRLLGERFSTNAAENIVTFGRSGTSAPPPAIANVLQATANSLLVEVPVDASTGAISVNIATRGETSTSALEPPFQTFEVLPDPVITAVQTGRGLSILGQNFATLPADNEILFDSVSNPFAYALGHADANRLYLFNLDLLVGDHTVTVRIHGRASNVFPFTITAPPSAPSGGEIAITTLADGDVPDGSITLREALLIAAGTLGRALTEPPDPRPPNTTYETDFVSSSAGAGVADLITEDGVMGSIVGDYVVTAPLPPVPSFDTIQLFERGVDGTGVAGDGFVFDGVQGATLKFCTVRGFGGNGVHVLNGANFNNLNFMSVQDCGGHGFFFDTSASNNTIDFQNSTVSGNGGDGLRFSGNQVFFNRVISVGSVDNNGGWGVLVDNGASFNSFEPHIHGNTAGGFKISGANTNYNYFGTKQPFAFLDVFDNTGPGVLVESGNNTFENLSIAGSTGDGLVLQTGTCRNVIVQNLRIGIEALTSTVNGNQGNGISVRTGAGDIQISGGFIEANGDNGILLQGPGITNVNISNVEIAGTQFNRVGNGLNGIALIDGVENCTISDCTLTKSANGAGIFFSGNTTRKNLVADCVIGDVNPASANRYGVRIMNGANSNTIGRLANVLVFDENDRRAYFGDRETEGWSNDIINNTDAGVLLESGGIPITGDTPSGGNVIQNNRIGGGSVGILIKNGAMSNRIGGNVQAEANVFLPTVDAGIEFDGVVHATPLVANRVIGNYFPGNLSPSGIGDPLLGPPGGVGILVGNGSSKVIIGGQFPAEANVLLNQTVGIYVDQSSEITISTNNLGGGDGENMLAGIFLNGSSNCLVGPNNQVLDTDLSQSWDAIVGPPVGGIVLLGGQKNRVIGNWIEGNNPHGIYVQDSANNQIGERPLRGDNTILTSLSDGIRVTGASSTGNAIQGNNIGAPLFALAPGMGNGGAGIRLDGGASANVVGDLYLQKLPKGAVLVPAPNSIVDNLGDGVSVDGALSVGNIITYNSISGNAFLGIALTAGGNRSFPEPFNLVAIGDTIQGSVDALVPNGSLVQLFSDTGNQGSVFLADCFASGGKFSADIPVALRVFANVTATVTNLNTDDTSEFSTSITPPIDGVDVRRHGPPPATVPVPAASGLWPVLLAKVTTADTPAVVTKVKFTSTGTADLSTSVEGFSIYLDSDNDGQLGEEDESLVGPVSPTPEKAVPDLEFQLSLEADEVEYFFLVVHLSAGAIQGGTLHFTINSNADITTHAILPSTVDLLETGQFPVQSDTLEVQSPSLFTVVPDLLGLNKVQAEAALSGNGLVLGTESQNFSNTVAAGLIIVQDPAPDVPILIGGEVDITTSLGQFNGVSAGPADIDMTGTVDAVDVQLIVNAALGLPIAFNADVNNDGNIDAVDVQLVINAALGL
jgi:parallel beta-helix repeat protein